MVTENRYQVIALLCLLQLSVVHCEGHECGDNPMRQVLLVAKRTGRTLGHVLTLLKEIDNPAYDNLSHQFRSYAACVGLVDTGYFRKRSYNEYVHPPYTLQMNKEKQPAVRPLHQFNLKSIFNYKKQENHHHRPNEMFSQQQQEDPETDPDLYDQQQEEKLYDKIKSDPNFDKKDSRNYNVERLKKWLYGPYRNYMNSYYMRWNLLWPLVNEE